MKVGENGNISDKDFYDFMSHVEDKFIYNEKNEKEMRWAYFFYKGKMFYKEKFEDRNELAKKNKTYVKEIGSNGNGYVKIEFYGLKKMYCYKGYIISERIMNKINIKHVIELIKRSEKEAINFGKIIINDHNKSINGSWTTQVNQELYSRELLSFVNLIFCIWKYSDTEFSSLPEEIVKYQIIPWIEEVEVFQCFNKNFQKCKKYFIHEYLIKKKGNHPYLHPHHPTYSLIEYNNNDYYENLSGLLYVKTFLLSYMPSRLDVTSLNWISDRIENLIIKYVTKNGYERIMNDCKLLKIVSEAYKCYDLLCKKIRKLGILNVNVCESNKFMKTSLKILLNFLFNKDYNSKSYKSCLNFTTDPYTIFKRSFTMFDMSLRMYNSILVLLFSNKLFLMSERKVILGELYKFYEVNRSISCDDEPGITVEIASIVIKFNKNFVEEVISTQENIHENIDTKFTNVFCNFYVNYFENDEIFSDFTEVVSMFAVEKSKVDYLFDTNLQVLLLILKRCVDLTQLNRSKQMGVLQMICVSNSQKVLFELFKTCSLDKIQNFLEKVDKRFHHFEFNTNILYDHIMYINTSRIELIDILIFEVINKSEKYETYSHLFNYLIKNEFVCTVFKLILSNIMDDIRKKKLSSVCLYVVHKLNENQLQKIVSDINFESFSHFPSVGNSILILFESLIQKCNCFLDNKLFGHNRCKEIIYVIKFCVLKLTYNHCINKNWEKDNYLYNTTNLVLNRGLLNSKNINEYFKAVIYFLKMFRMKNTVLNEQFLNINEVKDGFICDLMKCLWSNKEYFSIIVEEYPSLLDHVNHIIIEMVKNSLLISLFKLISKGLFVKILDCFISTLTVSTSDRYEFVVKILSYSCNKDLILVILKRLSYGNKNYAFFYLRILVCIFDDFGKYLYENGILDITYQVLKSIHDYNNNPSKNREESMLVIETDLFLSEMRFLETNDLIDTNINIILKCFSQYQTFSERMLSAFYLTSSNPKFVKIMREKSYLNHFQGVILKNLGQNSFTEYMKYVKWLVDIVENSTDEILISIEYEKYVLLLFERVTKSSITKDHHLIITEIMKKSSKYFLKRKVGNINEYIKVINNILELFYKKRTGSNEIRSLCVDILSEFVHKVCSNDKLIFLNSLDRNTYSVLIRLQQYMCEDNKIVDENIKLIISVTKIFQKLKDLYSSISVDDNTIPSNENFTKICRVIELGEVISKMWMIIKKSKDITLTLVDKNSVFLDNLRLLKSNNYIDEFTGLLYFDKFLNLYFVKEKCSLFYSNLHSLIEGIFHTMDNIQLTISSGKFRHDDDDDQYHRVIFIEKVMFEKIFRIMEVITNCSYEGENSLKWGIFQQILLLVHEKLFDIIQSLLNVMGKNSIESEEIGSFVVDLFIFFMFFIKKEECTSKELNISKLYVQRFGLLITRDNHIFNWITKYFKSIEDSSKRKNFESMNEISEEILNIFINHVNILTIDQIFTILNVCDVECLFGVIDENEDFKVKLETFLDKMTERNLSSDNIKLIQKKFSKDINEKYDLKPTISLNNNDISTSFKLSSLSNLNINFNNLSFNNTSNIEENDFKFDFEMIKDEKKEQQKHSEVTEGVDTARDTEDIEEIFTFDSKVDNKDNDNHKEKDDNLLEENINEFTFDFDTQIFDDEGIININKDIIIIDKNMNEKSQSKNGSNSNSSLYQL